MNAAPLVGILALAASNACSVAHAIRRARGEPLDVREASDFARAEALIVPGVSNVGALLGDLDRRGLRAPLLTYAASGAPLLGICAGFQALFEASEEAPGAPGLGLLRGTVARLHGPKSPHVGWNLVASLSPRYESGWAYFANTFAPPATVPDACAATDYGETFASIAARGNVAGVQFHPERSGAYGAALLRAFVSAAKGVARVG